MQNKSKIIFSVLIVLLFGGISWYLIGCNPQRISEREFSHYYSTYDDGNVRFAFDTRHPVVEITNPVYPHDENYSLLGIGDLEKDGRYETELEYSVAAGWIDEDSSGVPTNMKLFKRQTFGGNEFAVFVDKTQHRRIFQKYENGYTVSISISDKERLPKYILLSSIIMQDKTNNDFDQYTLDTVPGYPCGIDGSECPPEDKQQ